MKTNSSFVSILGMPNVGKSSLLNRLVGEKVSIVTSKPQTTRNRITGVLTQGNNQYVFIDTPGMHTAKNKLSGYMVQEVKEALSGIEVALLLTEPKGKMTEIEQDLLKNLTARKVPIILVLNKIDTLDKKEDMMPKIQEFSEQFKLDHIVPISAINGDGVEELMKLLANYTVEGPHYFEPDSYTDQPERVIVSEMIREKLLMYLQDELPHGIAVEIESMKERPEQNLMDIGAVIYCEKASHKGMVIGKKGEMLKKIGSSARRDIETLLGIKVNLQCWVKVKEGWRNREGTMRDLGFK